MKEVTVAVMKVPDPDWAALAELGRQPEDLRTPAQMARFLIRRGMMEEATRRTDKREQQAQQST
jgi:hypothetical protein